MNSCAICGHGRPRESVCDWCLEGVDGLSAYSPQELIVVTDASVVGDGSDVNKKRDLSGFQAKAGGGIIVARRSDERVLTAVPVELYCWDSNLAELQAVQKAQMLVPGAIVWCDNYSAIMLAYESEIGKKGLGRFSEEPPAVRYLPDRWRNPLHRMAHSLATIARERDWEAYNRLVVPRRRKAA